MPGSSRVPSLSLPVTLPFSVLSLSLPFSLYALPLPYIFASLPLAMRWSLPLPSLLSLCGGRENSPSPLPVSSSLPGHMLGMHAYLPPLSTTTYYAFSLPYHGSGGDGRHGFYADSDRGTTHATCLAPGAGEEDGAGQPVGLGLGKGRRRNLCPARHGHNDLFWRQNRHATELSFDSSTRATLPLCLPFCLHTHAFLPHHTFLALLHFWRASGHYWHWPLPCCIGRRHPPSMDQSLNNFQQKAWGGASSQGTHAAHRWVVVVVVGGVWGHISSSQAVPTTTTTDFCLLITPTNVLCFLCVCAFLWLARILIFAHTHIFVFAFLFLFCAFLCFACAFCIFTTHTDTCTHTHENLPLSLCPFSLHVYLSLHIYICVGTFVAFFLFFFQCGVVKTLCCTANTLFSCQTSFMFGTGPMTGRTHFSFTCTCTANGFAVVDGVGRGSRAAQTGCFGFFSCLSILPIPVSAGLSCRGGDVEGLLFLHFSLLLLCLHSPSTHHSTLARLLCS